MDERDAICQFTLTGLGQTVNVAVPVRDWKTESASVIALRFFTAPVAQIRSKVNSASLTAAQGPAAPSVAGSAGSAGGTSGE